MRANSWDKRREPTFCLKGMIMKKNAVLIAGIMFVAGCASSSSQRASYSSYDYPSRYDRADVRVSSPSHVDTSTTVSVDPAAGAYGTTVTGSSHSDHIAADSSVRGGSLDARGYDQDANDDEIEPAPHALNPGKEADSSIRGGSIFAREREWNHDSEPSTGEYPPNRHMKADSSIRGGSVEARGGREARADMESDVDVDIDVKAGPDLRSSSDLETRDDFGQGSSATWQSDKASGSIRGSANWNSSDDLLRDDVNAEANNTSKYEFNNDASVGGAARSETGEGASSLDDEEMDSETDAAIRAPDSSLENDLDSSIRIETDLNSSEQLEDNISGDIDLDEQQSKLDHLDSKDHLRSSIDVDSSSDLNATDSQSSALSSERSTDIRHDTDLNASANVELDDDFEASGAAATSESGSGSSSDVEIQSTDEFDSNDPAMHKPGSPLGTAGGEPNFLYKDNRAHGVGSATSGDFANAPVNQNIELSNDDLAQRVKGTLTRESTGTQGLMRHEVARNIQVTAKDGEVTLTGTVLTQKDKDMLEVRAREIAGVKSVKNELSVTPDAEPSFRDATRGSDLEDVTSQLQD
jgi:hypothetical protein